MLKPGYKQTEVGIIPEDWEVSNIGTIANIIDPQPDHRTPPEIFGGEPYIGISDFKSDNNVNWDSCRKIIPKAVDKQQASFQLQKGDIIFGKIGTIGSPKFVPITPFRYALSANIILIKPKINSYYVMAWFKSDQVQKLINQELHSTSQAAFGINKMRHLQIPLPPTLEEQRAIAEALSDADALIESLEQLIAKKRAIKQGAMQELLTGKRRLPGFDGEWCQTTLNDITERIIGGGTPSRNVTRYWNGNIPWMTVKDFSNTDSITTLEYITNEGLNNSASNLIPKHTLIIATRMALGKAVIYEVPVSINQDLKALILTKDAHTLFLYYWFQFKGNVIAEMGNGSTVMGISLMDLKKIPFEKPSFQEQAAIANVLSDMDSEIAALEAKLNKAQQIKQGMMQELLTGKTRLLAASSSCPEPTDIPKQLEVSS